MLPHVVQLVLVVVREGVVVVVVGKSLSGDSVCICGECLVLRGSICLFLGPPPFTIISIFRVTVLNAEIQLRGCSHMTSSKIGGW